MHLENFKEGEFREWWHKMSPRLLTMIDLLRYRLGSGIEISKAHGAIGRELGPDKQSEHNVDLWGEVLAVDCFVSGVYYREQAEAVVDEAIKLGFTGIGVYPGWRNNKGIEQVGFHLGVRPTRKMGSPSTWGYIGKKEVSLMNAIQLIKTASNNDE